MRFKKKATVGFLAVVSSIILFATCAVFLRQEDKTAFYFIAKECEKNDDAGKLAAIAKQRNGAGYIYEACGKRYILLMGYEDSSVAEKIAANMSEEYIVFSIFVNEDNIELSNCLLKGMLALEKELDENGARKCVLDVAKSLNKNNNVLYNHAMKTYSSSRERLSYSMKYLYVSLLLQK